MGRTTWALLAAMGLWAMVPATAEAQQPLPSPNCADDDGRDRCAAEEQARARALFGVPPIAQLAADRGEAFRVFYVDGYGRDLIAITARRIPDGRAELGVAYPAEGGTRPGPIVAPLAPARFAELRAQAAAAVAAAGSPVRGESGGTEASICLHAWVYTLEAAGGRGARAQVEDACRKGAIGAFAVALAKATLPYFAACAALDPSQHRNAASRIAACRMLQGERTAAAHAFNRHHALHDIKGPEDAPRLADLFAPGARLDWNGVRPGPAGPAAFWAGRAGPDGGGSWSFYVRRVEGFAPDRARLHGELSRRVDGPDRRSRIETAAVELHWTRGGDGLFRVERATVGPWRRTP